MANSDNLSVRHYQYYTQSHTDPRLLWAKEIIDPEGNNRDLRMLVPWIYHLVKDKILSTNGYYMYWDEKICLALSVEIGDGMTFMKMQKFIDVFIQSDLFDKGLYEGRKILTSFDVQDVWAQSKKRMKSVQRVHPDLKLQSKDVHNTPGYPHEGSEIPEYFRNTPEKSGNPPELSGGNGKFSRKFAKKPDSLLSNDKSNNNKGIGNTHVITIDSEIPEKSGNPPEFSSNPPEKSGLPPENNGNTPENSGNSQEIPENSGNTPEGFGENGNSDHETAGSGVLIATYPFIDSQNKRMLDIDNCLYQFMHNPIFLRTRDQACPSIRADSKAEALDKLHKWGEAFNRHLISEGITQKMMVAGSEGWVGHFKRWMNLNIGKDPETLYTVNLNENDAHQSSPGQTTGGQRTRTAKIGGIDADKAAGFYGAEVQIPRGTKKS